MDDPIIALDKVSKHYVFSGNRIQALNEISFTVSAATMVAFVGPSGSGKSTLLNIIGALDRQDSGQVIIQGRPLGGLSEAALTAHRRRTVGFVFQDYGLIPNLSALENVALPMEFARVPRKEARRRSHQLLDDVGMAPRTAHRPAKLSGGEQQRVAIARSLANDPAIILADEPTGNLDSATGQDVVELMRRLVDDHHKTVIVVSHDESVAQMADTVLHIQDGKIV